MGSLLGRDTNGLLQRPLGPRSLQWGGGSHGPFCWRGNSAEPLYQRVEHCLTAGSRGCGRGRHSSEAPGLDVYSQCHCVAPTVASPNADRHRVESATRSKRIYLSFVLTRSTTGPHVPSSTQLGLKRGLNRLIRERNWGDCRGVRCR